MGNGGYKMIDGALSLTLRETSNPDLSMIPNYNIWCVMGDVVKSTKSLNFAFGS